MFTHGSCGILFSSLALLAMGFAQDDVPEDTARISSIGVAITTDSDDIPDFLREGTDQNEPPLIKAMRTRSSEAIDEALRAGADINAQNEHGETALWYIDRYITESSLLTRPELNPNIRKNTGETALMHFLQQGDMDVVHCLLKLPNIDVNIADNLGETALMKAVRFGCFDAIEPLLKAGAKVNAQNNRGFTALMFAAAYNDLMPLLRHAFAADIAADDKVKKQAIEHLVATAYAKCIQQLIHAGADVMILNDRGRGALDYGIADPGFEFLQQAFKQRLEHDRQQIKKLFPAKKD